MMTSDLYLPLALGAFALFVNAFAFFAFWLDKRRAMDGGWRLPEANLLILALFGGWIGAKLAQLGLRHKARKQPFATVLNGIVLLWLAGVPALLFGPELRQMIPGAVVAEEPDRPMPRRFGPGSD